MSSAICPCGHTYGCTCGKCPACTVSEPDPHMILVIARALGWAEGEHSLWNKACYKDAEKVWAALLQEGFVEDRVDIGASGYCEALVLMFKHHA